MSQIQVLKDRIGDEARDIRLNLEAVLSEEGAPGLSKAQLGGVALSVAYALKNPELIAAIQSDLAVDEAYTKAAKSAAAVMAMNNIYYRFLHLSEDKEFGKMPAKLRMTVIGKPGIEKVDFELMSLAISAIAGCGMCINAHIHEVKKGGVSNEGIQSAIRIASVLNAANVSLSL